MTAAPSPARLLEHAPLVLYARGANVPYPLRVLGGDVPGVLGWERARFDADPFSWDALVHPQDRPLLATTLAQLQSGTALVIEYRLRHADGRYRWCRDWLRHEPGDAGGPQISGMLVDIDSEVTARERARRRGLLLDAISRAQAGFIASEDPHALFAGLLDDLLAFSDSGWGFIGEIQPNADGRPGLQLQAIAAADWDQPARTLHAEAAAHGALFTRFDQVFGAAFDDNRLLIANHLHDGDIAHELADGDPPITSFLGVPIRHVGRLLGMVGLANRPDGYQPELADFLEPLLATIGQLIAALNNERRRRAEAASRDRLALLVSKTTHAVVLANADGLVEWVNQAFTVMTGYTLEEIRGRRPSELLQGPGTDPATTAAIRSALVERRRFQGDVLCRTRAGGALWMRVALDPLEPDRDGEGGFIAIASDVTVERREGAAAQQARNELQAVIDSATQVCVIATDPAGTIVLFNRGAELLLGWPAGDVVGRCTPVQFLQPAELGARAAQLSAELGEPVAGLEALLAYARRGRHDERIWTCVRRDGAERQVNIGISAVRGRDEAVVGFLAVALDVTERLRAQRLLEEQRQHLQLVIEGTQLATWDWNPQTGEMHSNDRRASMLGYRPDEMPARYDAWLDLSHPADLPRALQALADHLDGRTPRFEVEQRMRHRDGHWIYVTTRGSVTARDADGRAVRVSGTDADITARKEAELAAVEAARTLAAHVDRTQAILDNVLDGIVTVDERGTIESVNRSAARLFGYRPDELIGENARKLVPNEQRAAYDGWLMNHLNGDGGSVLGRPRELQGLRADGSEFPVELTITEVKRNSRPVLIGVLRDITERKRIEQIKNEFVSTVSHELRTPLTSIRGAIGLIAGGSLVTLPPAAAQLVTIAEKNIARLSQLINDLLDMEKIAAGQMRILSSEQSLRALIDFAVEANRMYADGFGVRYVVEPGEDAHALVDPDRLGQVLSNFLSNAAKFSPAGTAVTIRLRRHGGWATIEVEDSGPGINDEFRGRVFQKFSQADGSDTRRHSGTGLGLAISKELVERMGGRIGFVSEPGHGATFYCAFPALQQALAVDTGGHRVLVVEDDPEMARWLVHALERHGVVCDIAVDAEDALIHLDLRTYDALTLDLQLGPGEDGIALLRRLRSRNDTRGLAVVVVSGDADMAAREHHDDNRVVAWLPKPADRAQLLQAVDAALSQTHARQPRVLHVEDDGDLARVVAALGAPLAHFDRAATLAEARERLARQHYSAVILDAELSDGPGWDLLPDVRRQQPAPPVLVLSAVEVANSQRAEVDAAFVKSQVSDRQLFDTLRNLLAGPGTRP